MNQSQEPRRGSIIGPLILITIGGLFLLANFGYITSSFWLMLVQFWPLILILAGLEILLGRTRGGQLIVLLVGLLAVGGILWLLINPGTFAIGTSMNTDTIDETRDGVDTANLELKPGVGGMEVVMPSNAGTVTAKLDGGIGGLTILIPQGVAARIRSHSGISGATINQARFPRVGEDLYESPDYATATNKIDLDVNAGIGGITLP